MRYLAGEYTITAGGNTDYFRLIHTHAGHGMIYNNNHILSDGDFYSACREFDDMAKKARAICEKIGWEYRRLK